LIAINKLHWDLFGFDISYQLNQYSDINYIWFQCNKVDSAMLQWIKFLLIQYVLLLHKVKTQTYTKTK